MRNAILILSILLTTSWSGVVLAECPQAYPLFKIERSKNKHIVQYDICVSENGDISDPKPVRVYWILENGERHDLNFIQAMLAYGIDSQERLGENKYRIAVVALKDRKIVVEKSPAAGYRASRFDLRRGKHLGESLCDVPRKNAGPAQGSLRGSLRQEPANGCFRDRTHHSPVTRPANSGI